MKLPLIPRNKKWLVASLSYMVFVALYTLTGNLHLRTPVVLSPLRIDQNVPFLDWTIWIYHSQFFLLAFNIALLKDEEKLSRVFYALNLASLLSFLIFFIYPTTIPRIPQNGAGLTMKAFAVLYSLDSPTNCFPSLHISLAWLSAIGVAQEHKKLGVFVGLWTVLISISTMSTKQHYVIDVLGGLLVAIVCLILLSKAKFESER
jgi:membrane-associated phospholipid phosphatase